MRHQMKKTLFISLSLVILLSILKLSYNFLFISEPDDMPFTAASFDVNEKITYSFINEPIDVIIPTAAKDSATLDLCIEGIRKNCKNVRRIIVVSPKKITSNAEWFDEANYPFSKYDVSLHLNGLDPQHATKYLKDPKSRLGWFYQQLLKLYAPYTIPGISSNVLIVDADTVFMQPTEFVNAEGGGNYGIGSEYHKPYFQHADRLLPGLRKLFPDKSGVCHHMLFQKTVLDDLFAHVEKIHQKEFWKAFCECVDPKYIKKSGASEYEIYFNFVLARTDQVKIRPLKWKNSEKLTNIAQDKVSGYDYVSYHEYLRR